MNRNKYFTASLMLFIFSFICLAQNPTVEENFQPTFSRTNESAYVLPFVQPDGKVVIAGRFQTVNGLNRFNVSRQNADGSTDTTFNCPACAFDVTNVAFQPDGKILVAGQSFFSYYEKIIRINADGSLDTSFSYAPTGYQPTNTLTVKGIQPDGKILVINRISASGGATDNLFRLNPNGSRDNSFQTFTINLNNGSLNAEVLPDGRTFVYGNNSYGFLALLNADGTKSNLFESPALTDSASAPTITDITLQSDGKIAFVGRFTAVNGLSRKNIARLNSDQSVDTTFNASQFTFPFGADIAQIIALSNNKLLIGRSAVINAPKLIRLNNDGTTDTAFNVTANISYLWGMQIDSAERIYVGGIISFPTPGDYALLAKFNTDGSLDTTHAPKIWRGGTVTALGLQTDGKILVGGNYVRTNSLTRNVVSRINADGSTDPTFDAGETFTGLTINDFAVQTDGKILVGANSDTFRRLNSNGGVDATFSVTLTGSGTVNDIALQPDGKILIGGTFTNVNGTPKNAVARLNADGTLDSGFNVQLGAGSSISRIIVQADGKIMIAGGFSGINGFNRSHLARVNGDGTLDTTFNATVNGLLDLTVQPDGKYLALNSTRIYRLLTDGSADGSFTSPALSFGSYTAFVLLDDGTIVVSGSFNIVNGIGFFNYIRLKSDGSLDTTSFTKTTESWAKALLKQPDGKILAGGEFKVFENLPRTGLARLVFPAITRTTPFDSDGDGRADIGVYRPSNSTWYQLTGVNYQFSQRTFGTNGDIPVPGDFDGDGKMDFAIFRPSENGNSNSRWIYITSRDNVQRFLSWGLQGDIPLASDVNGDGTADFVIYRPSNNVWYRQTTTGLVSVLSFGSPGDKPVIGDFDGDGKSDYAIYRPSTGAWWYAASSAGNAFRATQWGIPTDIPVPADYDGDGKTDLAVFRPSNGVWYILNTGNGSATVVQFGLSEDKPVAADYDGDGKADIAVFRPSTGVWYLLRTTAGFAGIQWGISSDIPLPNAFIQQ